jgi:hypothetical protein
MAHYRDSNVKIRIYTDYNFVYSFVCVGNLVPDIKGRTWNKVFENRVLTRIFGLKVLEATGGCRRLHNEKLRNSHS